MMISIMLNLFILALGLFVLYRTILLAVREGMNQSIIGKLSREKYESHDIGTFYNNDLDND